MVAISLIRFVTLCLLASTVSGCAFAKAVTFRSDNNSFKRGDAKTELEIYARHNPNDCVAGPPRWPRPAPDVLRPQALPLLLPLAGAAVGVAVNVGLSEINAYLDRKKREFTYAYRGIVNRPLFYARAEPWDWAIERAANNHLAAPSVTPYSQTDFNCLRLTRILVGKDDKGVEVATPAFVWVAAIVPNGSGTALKIQTKQIDLPRSAARTGTEGHVDVTVEIKIDAVVTNAKRESIFTTVADKILDYPAVPLHGDEPLSAADQTHVKNLLKIESSWFPLVPKNEAEIARCTALTAPDPPKPAPTVRPEPPGEVSGKCGGVTAVTVAVLVTETGSGADAFGNLAKQIDDNKKTLQDAFTKGVTDALTPKDDK